MSNMEIELDANSLNGSVSQNMNQTSTSRLFINGCELEEHRTPLQIIRKKLRFIITHIAFRFILILVDIVIVILDLALVAQDSDQREVDLDWAAFGLICYFIVEVNLRLLAFGARQFMRSWFNIVDYVIVVFSFITGILSVFLTVRHFGEYAKLIVVGRLVRVAVFVRLFTERKNLEAGVRNMVSQNKRRFVKDGFDLDLTYVTETVIAMSFPSSGKMAIYRNPIKEVAKFLDRYHPNNYKVYNLCSEKTYDESYFHYRVARFPFDDHNPPPLAEMFRFTCNVNEWLSVNPHRIVAIHCKGGKGRTGTMITAWLIESGKFESIKDCLGYFGSRRTDLELGNKYQGVETPSQNRYVAYYWHVKNILKRDFHVNRTLQLEQCEIYSIRGIGKGDGSDFKMEIQDGGKHCILWVDFGRLDPKTKICFNHARDCFCITFNDGPLLRNDVKMTFHCSSTKVPRTDKDVAFFFWFHTSFITDQKLVLQRNEIDNAHKRKTWRTYTDKFQVKLSFKEITDL